MHRYSVETTNPSVTSSPLLPAASLRSATVISSPWTILWHDTWYTG